MSPETSEADRTEAQATASADVKVQPSSQSVEYKTRVIFLDGQKKDIISVVPPQVQQTGLIQFVLKDRVIVIPIGVIRWSETEQLKSIEPSKIIVSST